MLYVDCRYRGTHGIGRFAREVIARLPVEFRELPIPCVPRYLQSTYSMRHP